MFNCFFTLLPVAALAAVVAAGAIMTRQDSFCNTGEIVCCDNNADPSDDVATQAAAAVGLSLADVQGLVGLACSPYSGIGVGDNGGDCVQEPLCCFNNSWGGLVTIGCSPISISL